ncbi:MAG: hypothetical protein RLZZ308_7 [Candidatus Parcubacteria bacterium]|jgi:8-oxo-dGTP pyrophosphatase MutT (NUDIX family)
MVASLKKPKVRATVTLLVDDEGRVALARKKQAIHSETGSIEYSLGLYNGYGGKMDEEDITIEDTAIRELVEEAGVEANKEDLQKVFTAFFYIEKENSCEPFMEVVFFTLSTFDGVPVENNEMGEPEWFTKDALPYHDMMPADKILFTSIFSGNGRDCVVVLRGKHLSPIVEEVYDYTFVD